MSGYGWIGLALMVVSQLGTFARLEPFWSWNTPIAWTGFILFADAVVWRVRGNSWLRSNPREFAALAVLSIPLWLVFEAYNLRLRNWYYTGLPENFLLRLFGYAWSFATISPAIFEAAELVAVLRKRDNTDRTVASLTQTDARSSSGPRERIRLSAFHSLLMALGGVMLVAPLLVSVQVAPYLAAPVWLGFILLLDPINFRFGSESLIGDLGHGRTGRLINLLWSGLLCGLLWEFWNYWSRAKWHYTLPVLGSPKLFEMPLAGYLGFPPFAIECLTMYVFVRTMIMRPWSQSPDCVVGRTIAL